MVSLSFGVGEINWWQGICLLVLLSSIRLPVSRCVNFSLCLSVSLFVCLYVYLGLPVYRVRLDYFL